jgi:TolA-binding protein
MRLGSPTFAIALFVGALMALDAAGAAAAAVDHFAAASEHYRRGRWQQAFDEFAKLLATDPPRARAAEARFYCGEALVQLGRWDEARRNFAELLAGDPNGTHARQARFRV